jgi:hypothetical protein
MTKTSTTGLFLAGPGTIGQIRITQEIYEFTAQKQLASVNEMDSAASERRGGSFECSFQHTVCKMKQTVAEISHISVSRSIELARIWSSKKFQGQKSIAPLM